MEIAFVYRRRLETEALVEYPSGLVLGVNEHGPAADDVGRLGSTERRIFQQARTNAFTLFVAIDGQSGQQDDRDRVPSEALGNSRGGFFPADRAGREGIVTHHGGAPPSHVRPRRLVLMIRQSVFLQVLVQRGGATVERREVVTRLRGTGYSAEEFPSSSKTLGLVRSCSRAGMLRGEASGA